MPALRTRSTHAALRPLAVSTASPPSFTVVSPTPRAFTFPISHNLSHIPASSPPISPFSPDPCSLDLSASSPSTTPLSSHNDEAHSLSARTWTLSPTDATPHSPSSPRWRKSTSSPPSAPAARRPKKGDDDYVKRPENAFILFRRQCSKDLSIAAASTFAPSSVSGPSEADSLPLAVTAPAKKQRQADLSKTISQQWKALSAEERAHWEALAKEKKQQHEALHPNYVYRPQRSGNKNRVNASASGASSSQQRKNSEPPLSHVEFIIPAPAQHARRASAPTPPPYQAVQVPNIYGSFSMDAHADPTSLLPILARHGMGNGNGGFDYMPSFPGVFDFDASLQSSDFLRSLFPSAMSPPSPPSVDTSTVLSPASSTSGSGPSSPYTPSSTAFHPSIFSASYTSTPLDDSYPTIGLDLDLTDLDEPAIVGSMEEADYSSSASAWAAPSPWSTTAGVGLTQGDFEIGYIPEIGCGWEPDSSAQSALTSSEFLASFDGEMHECKKQELENGGELDLHFGDAGMDEMGLDQMMTEQGF
ncbi:hypothetical protein C8F04DRAFT_659055 [Mycena alexandri]|uniref:HMG box domain-containing protein n=1 Tax=Mycena alexandri TaxID=1745969 RepID=A0AAD6SRN8_9AGAR|nr:hypothetical protein C8F04DRAFT_659055 [Mycena alexandri]